MGGGAASLGKERNVMIQPDQNSERWDDHQAPQSDLPSKPITRLIMPGFGLTVALVAVVCFAEDLRPADSAKAESSESISADESDAASPVGLIPGADSDAQRVAEAAESAVPATVRQLLSQLESGQRFLRGTKRYAATFTQQVYKDGQLLDPEEIELKVQHEPFAVFMEWEKDGQQALYVEGENENKLLVHPTRGFGRLRKVWILDPDSGLAMRGSRRPVTEIGLLNLVDLLLGFHREHLLCSKCVAQPADVGEAGSTRYTLTFNGPHENPYYAKTVLWLCNERHLPLRIENYFWTDDNRVGPLLESYHYTGICVDGCVVEADFSRENEAYKF
jgi:hypothetical protein